MPNKERLTKLTQKSQARERGVSRLVEIHQPNEVDPETQAEWMIELLSQIYVEHGIAKAKEKIKNSIQSGQTKTWFATNHTGKPIATASLINLGNKVELGRGASIKRGEGIGGQIMRLAAIDHLTNNPHKPLLAEVRLAQKFKKVPGSTATQKISFKEIGFTPHAAMPTFTHGDPIRTELFAFSCIQAESKSNPLFIPNNPSAEKLINSNVTPFLKELFPQTKIIKTNPPKGQVRWQTVQTQPFKVLEASKEGKTINQALNTNHHFTLIPLEATKEHAGEMNQLLKTGAIPCGIDRETGVNNHPTIFFGFKNPKTLLAPTLITHNIPENLIPSIKNIDKQFRNNKKR